MGTGAALTEGVDAIISALAAANIRAVMDIADLNPPGVLVPVPAPEYRFGGCARITYTLLLVAPAVGRYRALAILGDLLDRVVATLVIAPTGITTVDVIPSNGEPLPAFQFAFTTTT